VEVAEENETASQGDKYIECQMTGLNRAGFYRWRVPRPVMPVEMEIGDKLQKIALESPAYGYRELGPVPCSEHVAKTKLHYARVVEHCALLTERPYGADIHTGCVYVEPRDVGRVEDFPEELERVGIFVGHREFLRQRRINGEETVAADAISPSDLAFERVVVVSARSGRIGKNIGPGSTIRCQCVIAGPGRGTRSDLTTEAGKSPVAASGIDREHDRADCAADRRISCPLLVLWSGKGPLGTWYEKKSGPIGIWREWAVDVRGEALDAGHFFPEELPQRTAEILTEFFNS
jgi:pimeloyl-ACP methyl ester carboxylesterase